MAKNEHRSTREVLIRVQSVQVIPLTIGGGIETIGQHIDRLLDSEAIDNRLPNRLAIDLNPKMERNYSDMDQ